jgi:O-Antigen ligase
MVMVLLLAPVVVPLAVWAGSSIGHYTAWRLGLDVLVLVAACLGLVLLVRDKPAWGRFWRQPLVWAIAAYGVLHLLLGLLALGSGRVTAVAFGDALILNLQFLLFFAVCVVMAHYMPNLRAKWPYLLLGPAAMVVAFGLMQIFVLPADFLKHIGYGHATIPAYETVDQKLQFVRVQSTLRGPNPLGAYLVITAAALSTLLFAKKLQLKRWIALAIFAGATGAVLFFSYSRSAYIGAALAAGLTVWLAINNNRVRRMLLLLGAVGVIVTGGAALALQHNDRFQNTFFHSDEHSRAAVSSNKQRATALSQGIRDVAHEPLGRGPGTAGPASVHNDHLARIAENYYLQIGQEVGVLGLALFIAINVLVAEKLWRKRAEPLSRLLLGSLVGITFINMLSHAWTDNTLALIWWGLAGLALAPAILARDELAKATRH